MRFEKASEVIDHATDFHHKLSNLYQNLAADKTGKPRMLLDYLVQHELESSANLNAYKENAPLDILETWFQYTNDEALLQIPTQEETGKVESLEDIIKLAMSFSEELVGLYTNIAGQADLLPLKEVFLNLADMQKQDQRQFSMNVDRLMDL